MNTFKTAVVCVAVVMSCAAAAVAQLDAADAAAPLRDPFVPVGYQEPVIAPPPTPGDPTPVVPVAPVATNALPVIPKAQPDWAKATERLGREVGAVAASSGRHVVLISGKMAEVGQKVALSYNGFRYTWRINAISKEKGLDLRRVAAVPK